MRRKNPTNSLYAEFHHQKSLFLAGAAVLLAASFGCQQTPLEPETEDGGMKQFDTTSEVTVTGSGSWTNPAAENWGAE